MAPVPGLFYKNIPAFQLRSGDTLAFDTRALNDADIQFDIDLAATTVNGGDVPATPFARVVLNNQTAADPRGDAVQGNFDLAYQTIAPFSFPGGGLIIRFSNSSPTYAADGTCTGNIVAGSGTDTSGFFVKRSVRDADGTAPWENNLAVFVGAFRLQLAEDPPPEALCQGKKVTISGSNGSDVIRGTKKADVITTLGGRDRVSARKGNDVVCLGGGKDRASGGRGRDKIDGEGGKDLLGGGKGADQLRGGPGADILRGGAKDDLCIGGAGRDKSNNC